MKTFKSAIQYANKTFHKAQILRVYNALLVHANFRDPRGFVWPGKQALCDELGINRTNLNTALRELHSLGEIIPGEDQTDHGIRSGWFIEYLREPDIVRVELKPTRSISCRREMNLMSQRDESHVVIKGNEYSIENTMNFGEDSPTSFDASNAQETNQLNSLTYTLPKSCCGPENKMLKSEENEMGKFSNVRKVKLEEPGFGQESPHLSQAASPRKARYLPQEVEAVFKLAEQYTKVNRKRFNYPQSLGVLKDLLTRLGYVEVKYWLDIAFSSQYLQKINGDEQFDFLRLRKFINEHPELEPDKRKERAQSLASDLDNKDGVMYF